MAGTLFGLPLSQRHDLNGAPLSGGKLYVFAGGTTTPATAYKDFALTATLTHPHPIALDSLGQIPMFWLADGTYRARLDDSEGNNQFDIDGIVALGPGVDEGDVEAGVDDNRLLQIGDVIWSPRGGTRTGFVRCNGRTIGSAASGATERANADCSPLYSFCWGNIPDSICPVSGGRGASAAADFAANKTLGLPSLRGRALFGLDDMGNASANVITAAVIGTGSPTLAGSIGGIERNTIAEANLPAIKPAITITDPGHFHHTTASPGQTAGAGGSGGTTDAQAAAGIQSDTKTTGITAALTNNLGSATPFGTISPFMLGTFYMKL